MPLECLHTAVFVDICAVFPDTDDEAKKTQPLIDWLFP